LILSNDISVKKDKSDKNNNMDISDKYDNKNKSVLIWRSSG